MIMADLADLTKEEDHLRLDHRTVMTLQDRIQVDLVLVTIHNLQAEAITTHSLEREQVHWPHKTRHALLQTWVLRTITPAQGPLQTQCIRPGTMVLKHLTKDQTIILALRRMTTQEHRKTKTGLDLILQTHTTMIGIPRSRTTAEIQALQIISLEPVIILLTRIMHQIMELQQIPMDSQAVVQDRTTMANQGMIQGAVAILMTQDMETIRMTRDREAIHMIQGRIRDIQMIQDRIGAIQMTQDKIKAIPMIRDRTMASQLVATRDRQEVIQTTQGRIRAIQTIQDRIKAIQTTQDQIKAIQTTQDRIKAIQIILDRTIVILMIQERTMVTQMTQDRTMVILAIQDKMMVIQEIQVRTVVILEIQVRTMAIRENQDKTMVTLEIQVRTMAIQEIQDKIMVTQAIQEIIRDTLVTQGITRDTQATQEMIRDTQATQEMLKDTQATQDRIKDTQATLEMTRDTQAQAIRDQIRDTLATQETIRDIQATQERIKVDILMIRDRITEATQMIQDRIRDILAIRDRTMASQEVTRDRIMANQEETQDKQEAIQTTQDKIRAIQTILGSSEISHTILMAVTSVTTQTTGTVNLAIVQPGTAVMVVHLGTEATVVLAETIALTISHRLDPKLTPHRTTRTHLQPAIMEATRQTNHQAAATVPKHQHNILHGTTTAQEEIQDTMDQEQTSLTSHMGETNLILQVPIMKADRTLPNLQSQTINSDKTGSIGCSVR